MNTRTAVQDRIKQLCKEQGITPNALSYRAGVPQATVKSILSNAHDATQNTGIVTIKKLCDGLNISLYEFFDTDIFRSLEQEIK